MKKALRTMGMIAILLGSAIPTWSAPVAADAEFAGGDGSQDDPYQIADWYHLDNVRGHLSYHFLLLSDLDSGSNGYAELAGPAAHAGSGWEPIGTQASPFTGSLEGQTRQVADIVVDRPGEDFVGLFGCVGAAGTVTGTGVANAQVSGRHYVGVLVGYNLGTVLGSYAGTGGTGVVGSEHVGCLIGVNEGSVSHCHAIGEVHGDSWVGGFMGWDEGMVSDSWAHCDVSGTLCVGGFVGEINNGTVTNSYAAGTVTAITAFYVGGFVGLNNGTVSNCCATGSATGLEQVGGLAGYNLGSIDTCFSTGSVSGTSDSGGLVGHTNDGTVTNSFWDTQTSGLLASDGGTGKTSGEMQEIATYRDQGTTGLTWPWNILAVAEGATLPYATWNIVDGQDYPFLTFGSVEVDVKAGWNMLSVPGGLADSANTVADVFGNQIVAIYSWDPVAKSYNVPTALEPYQGYWVAVTEDKTLILRI